MKKIYYYLLLCAFLIISCKKDSPKTPETVKNTSPELVNGYYKVGTIIRDLNSVAGFNIDALKQSYAQLNGVTGPNQFPQAARGHYTPGQEVARSTSGLYSLFFQGDGNLVLYKRNGVDGSLNFDALWASNALGSTIIHPGNYPFTLDIVANNGNVVCTNFGGQVYWAGNIIGGPNPLWILQDDGNFVGYGNWKVEGSDPRTSTSLIKVLAPAFASTNTFGGGKSPNFGRFITAN